MYLPQQQELLMIVLYCISQIKLGTMIFLPSSNIFISKDKKELKVKSAVENMQK
jgi:hypothetical protein